jgi:hypothetical protein
MLDPTTLDGLEGNDTAWLRGWVHDTCQPLTALECGLYLGTMSADGVGAPTAEELLVTILQALEQCERVSTQLRTLRNRLQGEG